MTVSAGPYDYRDVLRSVVSLQLAQYVPPVGVGELQVEHDDVGLRRDRQRERTSASVRLEQLVAAALRETLNYLLNHGVVVRKQNSPALPCSSDFVHLVGSRRKALPL